MKSGVVDSSQPLSSDPNSCSTLVNKLESYQIFMYYIHLSIFQINISIILIFKTGTIEVLITSEKFFFPINS